MEHREGAGRNGRLEDIHSLDDRYVHDVDELMAQPRSRIERAGPRVYSLPRSRWRLAFAEAH